MTNVFGGFGTPKAGGSGDCASRAEVAQKATRAAGAKYGHVATLTSDGDLADSGVPAAALATREYVNALDALRVLKTRDIMSGDLDLRGGRLTNLGRPERDTDAVNRRFVTQRDQDTLNTCLGLFLPLDGSAKAKGDLSLGWHSVREVANPAYPGDAATSQQIYRGGAVSQQSRPGEAR